MITMLEHKLRTAPVASQRLKMCALLVLLVGLLLGACRASPTSGESEGPPAAHSVEPEPDEESPVPTGWLALPQEDRKMIRETLREHPLIVYFAEDASGIPRSHLRVPLKVEALFEESPRAVIEQLIAAAAYAEPMESLKAIAWAQGLLVSTETAAAMESIARPRELKKYITPNERGFVERDYDIASLERMLAELR